MKSTTTCFTPGFFPERAKFLCTLFTILLLFSSSHAQPPTEGFYKDLFIDAGVHLGLSGRQEADSLGLVYEYVNSNDSVDQNWAMVGNAQDLNGALLYPDGSPRFRLLYTNGGYGNHGRTLGYQGQRQIEHFFRKGGSYVGSCNGAALSGAGTHNYRLWNSVLHGTDVGDENTVVMTSHFIPPTSPVRNYYSFPSHLHNIAHSGGYYFPSPIAGSEVVGLYSGNIQGPASHLDGKVGMVAYKANDVEGRLVVSGSHPEYAPPSYTDAKHLMEAFYLYALDGIGKPRLKATLSNGVEYEVDEVSGNFPMVYYGNYSRIKIGDKQYHHFKVSVPSGLPYLLVELDGADGYHLNVYARPGNEKVFASNAVAQDVSVGSDKRLLVTNPVAGNWHFSVECQTSVTANWNPVARRFDYVEEVPGVLNGVAYSIKATSLAAPPNVSFSGLATNYCLDDPGSLLTGTPAGGTFSGAGIVGSTFDPAVAGIGTHTVTYDWHSFTATRQVLVEAGSGPAPVISGPAHMNLGVNLTHLFSSDGHPDVVDYSWTLASAPYFGLVNYILDASGRKVGVRVGKVCAPSGGFDNRPPGNPVQQVMVTCTAQFCGGTQVSSSHVATYHVSEYLALGDPCGNEKGKKAAAVSAAEVVVFPNPGAGVFKVLNEELLVAGELIRVLDMAGRVIFETAYEEGTGKFDLGDAVRPGVYVVQMWLGERLVSRKLVVE